MDENHFRDERVKVVRPTWKDSILESCAGSSADVSDTLRGRAVHKAPPTSSTSHMDSNIVPEINTYRIMRNNCTVRSEQMLEEE